MDRMNPPTLVPSRARWERAIRRVVTAAAVRRLSLVTTIGMFLVVIMGTLVTNTNSQNGCGASWPLCRGQFIPQFAVSTFIEFSHRAVTGVESLLVIAMSLAVLWLYRARLEIRILAPIMVLFLLAQALLGALAVMNPESPEVLALHFGVSLISFVSILLTTIFVYEIQAWDKLRDRPLARGFRTLAWSVTGYTYVVVYIGAYVRHMNDSLACVTWPLCNGQVVPDLSSGMGLVFIHRFAALLLILSVGWLFVWARRIRRARPDLYRGSLAALVLVLAQALEGAIIVFSRLDLFSTLAHGGLVALLFGALCYVDLHTVSRPKAARARTAPDRHARTADSARAVAPAQQH